MRRTTLAGVVGWTLSLAPASALAQNPAVTVNVDAAADRRAINPLVYGVAFGDSATLPDLNCPLNRWGGNSTTRYNWQVNADNRGADWYFESIAYSSATAGEGPDSFIGDSKAAGAQPMMTIPTVGWVAKVGTNRSKLASFSIAKYGAQTGNDWQWFPDAGNGVRTNGTNVTGNDPADANVAAGSAFQQGWFQHLVDQWGSATSGGLRYYILDNEPSIWHSTHRDVHPTGATMDEIRDKVIDYGARIKATDAGALVVGPEEWGWSGYFYSGYDQQWGSQNGWSNLPDRNAHAGWDYLPWLLDQLRQDAATRGRRLLDVFTVHYYPQGGEFGDDVSSAMQLRRNRSTRSLWDPSYTDETWIADVVRLVPRLKQWVATYYPGTQIGITEYNWGAEGHINGATTQADVFGIFGREGLDIGARWTTPDPSTPTYKAMKMYRNYDGSRSTFGDTSVRAQVPNPDSLSSFAALRSADGALTVMVINKALSGNTPVTVSLAGFTAAGTAQAWQLTATNVIVRLSDVAVGATSFIATVPPQSVTLFVVPAGSAQLPSLSIGDVSVTEGNSGTVNATFTVTLSAASTQTVTVNWTSANGTATAGSDYLAGSGTLSFVPGVTTRPLTVVVNGDTAVEPSETFLVNLSSPSGATLGDGQGRGTITNDDSQATSKAVMQTPAPGSTLSGSTATFTWNAGTGVTSYWLEVGTTAGGKQIYPGANTTALSATVAGLPTNGSTVYVRLWSRISGVWQYNDYTYKASGVGGGSAKAVMQTPAPGSTLSGSTATFTWNAGAGVTSYWLEVGTTAGGKQIYPGASTTALSATVGGLPTNGSTVYVRLWSLISGAWQYNDYTYKASVGGGSAKAVMQTPAPGSTLAGSAVTFTWNAGTGVTSYWLEVGTTAGGNQLYPGASTTALSATVSGLPTNGSTVHVRLWSLISGAWQYNDYTYKASGSGGSSAKAVLQTPAPGSTLAGSTVTFTWNAGTGVTSYWLEVGTTPGGKNISAGSNTTSLSATVTGLPTNGSTLYVRLWSMMAGMWVYNDYTYIAATP